MKNKDESFTLCSDFKILFSPQSLKSYENKKSYEKNKTPYIKSLHAKEDQVRFYLYYNIRVICVL